MASDGRGPRAPQDGASAVEFALILPVLLLLVLGVIEFGLAFSRLQAMQAGINEAARVVLVGGDDEAATDVLAARVSGVFDPSDVDVTVTTPCDGDEAQGRVTAAVRDTALGAYAIRIPVPGFGVLSEPDYAVSAVVQCENVSSGPS